MSERNKSIFNPSKIMTAKDKEELRQIIREELLDILSPKKFYNTSELAEYLGLAPGTIRNHMHELPHVKRGKRCFFKSSEINDIIRILNQ